MIHDKKEPNRNSFPRETAILSDCGHRCDLCVHFTGAAFSDEFRREIGRSIHRAYSQTLEENIAAENKEFSLYKDFPPCDGCAKGGIGGKFDCDQIKCAAENNADKCVNCSKCPCDKSHAGLKPEIHAKTIYANDVTWAILPFVHRQYGN